jgi:urea transport system ATP-binding protein
MNILEIRNLTKRFGGLVAIDDLSIDIGEGELRCIIGPNGAGKSTLFNLICGNLEADGGQVIFQGESLNGLGVEQRSRLGLGRKFQAPAIFDNLTVVENLQVAAWGSSSVWNLTKAGQDEVAPLVDSILEQVDLADQRDIIAHTLSHGEKQWLEIGMVLASKPSMLLLDEPTAGMTPAETHRTSELIKEISGEITTVVIEHDLKFIREIGKIVTVLHHGSVLAEGPIDEIASDDTVRHAYLGSEEL